MMEKMIKLNGLKLVLLLFLFSFVGCVSSDDDLPGYREGYPFITTPKPKGYVQNNNPYSLGIEGSVHDIDTDTKLGLVIMGGGADVDDAFKWLIERSGGGDIVVLRASGTDAYNKYIFRLGTVNSVETLLIDSRSAANDEKVVQTIMNAEGLFIAGGDQSDYMDFWKDTETEEALNYLLNEKKVPFGGTSAGAAILGALYYSGENGSITGDAALSNPYNPRITLYGNDFLEAPFMTNVITDQHFSQRDREGRLVTFLGRIMEDRQVAANGIGVDEHTAVCIDEAGMAQVFGSNSAYFLMTNSAKRPEQLAADQNVQWKQNEQALEVYRIKGSNQGNGQFNVQAFDGSNASGGESQWWWVENGQLKTKNQ